MRSSESDCGSRHDLRFLVELSSMHVIVLLMRCYVPIGFNRDQLFVAFSPQIYVEFRTRVLLSWLQCYGGLFPDMAHATEPELYQQTLLQTADQICGSF